MSDSFESPWAVACQAPLFMVFTRQEYWSGLTCPPPGDFPSPGIETKSLISPTMAGSCFTTSATWEALCLGWVRQLVFSVEVKWSHSVISDSLRPLYFQLNHLNQETVHLQLKYIKNTWTLDLILWLDETLGVHFLQREIIIFSLGR